MFPLKAAILCSVYGPYMSQLTLELLRLLNFALLLSPDSFAYGHFLVQVRNLSSSGTWKRLPKYLYFSSKQEETSFSLWKRFVFVSGFVDFDNGFEYMIKRSMLFCCRSSERSRIVSF